MHNILPLLFTTWSLILLSQTSNKLTLSKITMLYIFQKGLVSTNVQHVMFTSFELFDSSLYLYIYYPWSVSYWYFEFPEFIWWKEKDVHQMMDLSFVCTRSVCPLLLSCTILVISNSHQWLVCGDSCVEMAILAPQGGQHLPDKTPCPTMKIW